jgi:hypothetical protein
LIGLTDSKGTGISADQAATLIGDAMTIQAVVGC